MMKYRHVLDRRTLLRGAGTVAIGLPLLEDMLTDSVYAQPVPPPARVLTMFVGLGIPAAFQSNSYVEPYRSHLEPLQQVASKICFPRGVYYEKGSRTTGNHARGSVTCFVGDRETGASVDQRVLSHLHGSQSPTSVRSLVAGTYTRQDGNSRHIHSWIGPRQPTAQPTESPRELFDRVFGTFMPGGEPPQLDPEEVKRARYERSILDAAMEQVRHVTSDAYGLGSASKSKVNLHLERIRELEQRIFDPDAARPPSPPVATDGSCPPNAPPEFTHPEMVEIQKTVNNEGVRMDVNRWMELWHAMADVYAMAVQCDVTRFGNIQFQSGGERIELYGSHTAYGQTRSFDDIKTSHDYWHGWSNGNDNERRMLDHIWLMTAEITYFLQALDNPEFRDANGKTILENALVLVGTELGDGRGHDIEEVFHLIAGANGAIRTGVVAADRQATELYNAGIRALGISDLSMEGDRDFAGRVADEVLT
ncbi:MAG: DUF1552 domain-containing protein [Myxococcota bacterium]